VHCVGQQRLIATRLRRHGIDLLTLTAGSVLALNHQTDMMRITAPAVLGEAALLRDVLPAAAERPFTIR